MNFKDKKSFFAILLLLFFSLMVLIYIFYIANTESVPASGGTYTEGALGKVRFLNPIYAPESDSDRNLTEILYSGLMDYDKSNELEPALAKNVEKDDGGRIFTVTLRDEIYWSDGEKITADDIIFTITALQSREVQSPIRTSWEGVRVEKISEKKVEFRLENPSPLFIEKLTLKPIPKHHWKDVPFEDFQFANKNMKPISSGPYKLDQVEETEDFQKIVLRKNSKYHGKSPYLNRIEFLIFENETELIEKKDKLDGFSLPSISNDKAFSMEEYSFQLPRYFSIFFNTDHFSSKIRKALAYGTDKQSLNEKLKDIEEVESPIMPEFYGFEGPETKYESDLEKASDLLKKAGFKKDGDYFEKVVQEERHFEFTERLSKGDQGEEVRELQRCLLNEEVFPEGEITGYLDSETKEAVNRFQRKYEKEILKPHDFENPTGVVASSTRKKLNELCGGKIPEEREKLTVEVTTIDHPLLVDVMKEISIQWQELGVKVKKETVNLPTIETLIIEEKNYQSFLFGINMESIPDLYRWWHSSQTESPGLNFTNYENEEVDSLLEKSVRTTDEDKRAETLEKIQELIMEDKPAIFLYSPNKIHLADEKIKGIEERKLINSSQRLNDIKYWHINTKRRWINNN